MKSGKLTFAANYDGRLHLNFAEIAKTGTDEHFHPNSARNLEEEGKLMIPNNWTVDVV